MKLLITKSRNGGQKNKHLFTITRTSLIVRRDLTTRLNLAKGDSASVGFNDLGQLCLFYKKGTDNELFTLSIVSKAADSLSISINKKNEGVFKIHLGDYAVSNITKDGDIYAAQLIKQ